MTAGPMSGKTVVVTGATSGIGKVTALELARSGARVIFTTRDDVRGEGVAREIAAAVPGAALDVLRADLSSMKEVMALGGEIRRRFPRVDVLVNNAGAIYPRRETTAEGLERTFATNHLAYFLLTRELLPVLHPPARVVNVASNAHRRGRMHFEDLELERDYSAWRAYGQSKLANVLFTRELARRLADKGVTANALHPGVVATGFGRNRSGLTRWLFVLGSPFLTTPSRGAQTTLYLATSPRVEGRTGGYYVRCKEVTPSRDARDDDAARRLWNESERILARVLPQ